MLYTREAKEEVEIIVFLRKRLKTVYLINNDTRDIILYKKAKRFKKINLVVTFKKLCNHEFFIYVAKPFFIKNAVNGLIAPFFDYFFIRGLAFALQTLKGSSPLRLVRANEVSSCVFYNRNRFQK